MWVSLKNVVQRSTNIRFMSGSGRVPLIKFRQGVSPPVHSSPVVSSSAGTSQTQSAASPRKVVSGGIIEDWQLPKRYQRRPISDEECLAINLGGAPIL